MISLALTPTASGERLSTSQDIAILQTERFNLDSECEDEWLVFLRYENRLLLVVFALNPELNSFLFDKRHQNVDHFCKAYLPFIQNYEIVRFMYIDKALSAPPTAIQWLEWSDLDMDGMPELGLISNHAAKDVEYRAGYFFLMGEWPDLDVILEINLYEISPNSFSELWNKSHNPSFYNQTHYLMNDVDMPPRIVISQHQAEDLGHCLRNAGRIYRTNPESTRIVDAFFATNERLIRDYTTLNEAFEHTRKMLLTEKDVEFERDYRLCLENKTFWNLFDMHTIIAIALQQALDEKNFAKINEASILLELPSKFVLSESERKNLTYAKLLLYRDYFKKRSKAETLIKEYCFQVEPSVEPCDKANLYFANQCLPLGLEATNLVEFEDICITKRSTYQNIFKQLPLSFSYHGNKIMTGAGEMINLVDGSLNTLEIPLDLRQKRINLTHFYGIDDKVAMLLPDGVVLFNWNNADDKTHFLYHFSADKFTELRFWNRLETRNIAGLELYQADEFSITRGGSFAYLNGTLLVKNQDLNETILPFSVLIDFDGDHIYDAPGEGFVGWQLDGWTIFQDSHDGNFSMKSAKTGIEKSVPVAGIEVGRYWCGLSSDASHHIHTRTIPPGNLSMEDTQTWAIIENFETRREGWLCEVPVNTQQVLWAPDNRYIVAVGYDRIELIYLGVNLVTDVRERIINLEVSKTPNIDGLADDWYDLPYFTYPHSEQQNDDFLNPEENDPRLQVATVRNAQNGYFLVEIFDKQVVLFSSKYKNFDYVEIVFDLRPERPWREPDEFIFKAMCYVDHYHKARFCMTDINGRTHPLSQTTRIEGTVNETGYVLEFALPLDFFKTQGDLPLEVGFTVIVNDIDETTSDHQKVMTSRYITRKPWTFGRLEFERMGW